MNNSIVQIDASSCGVIITVQATSKAIAAAVFRGDTSEPGLGNYMLRIVCGI